MAAPTDVLREFVATSRASLEADALILAVGEEGTPLEAVAADGIDAAAVREVLADVVALGGTFPVPRPLDPAASPSLTRHGFASGRCAELQLDGRALGVLVVLRTAAAEHPRDGLVGAVARHAAVAVAGARQPRSRALLPGLVADHEAFDRLALSSTNVTELTRAVAETLAPILGVPMTALMIYDEGREVLQMAPGSFGADEATTASYQISVFDVHSNAARVFATGQPYLSNHAAGDPGIRPDYVRAFGIERLLSVPLELAQRSIGVLHLANKPTDFTLDDLVRAQELASRVATVVEVARTSFRIRREERLERILSGLALAIASGENLQDVLSPALTQLGEATEASVVALVPTSSPPIVCRLEGGPTEREAALLLEARSQAGLRADVAVPTAVGDPGWATYHVPVHLRDQRVATLSALRSRGEPFAHEERHALSRVSHLAALAWAMERYQQQGAQLARMEERQRISDELHDDVRQMLVEAQSRIDRTLSGLPADAPAQPQLEHARSLVIRGFGALRTAVHQETPNRSGADLPLRLRTVVSGVEDEFPIPVRLELRPEVADVARGLPGPVADVVVKVAREALVNAAKHGGPCQVLVRLDLSTRGHLRLSVIDDGVGMPTAGAADPNHGLGFLRRALREHGGRLRVQSAAADGTSVVATVPV